VAALGCSDKPMEKEKGKKREYSGVKLRGKDRTWMDLLPIPGDGTGRQE